MSRHSCITPPKKALYISIREEYVGVCKSRKMKHPHCAAALLHCFEHWHNFKLENLDEALAKYRAAKEKKQPARVNVNMWIFMAKPKFKIELQGLFGDKLIAQSLQDLADAKFLKTRENPENSWDRTTQYLFFPSRVQKAIDLWACSSEAPSRISALSRRQKRALDAAKKHDRDGKNAGALPQESSHDLSQHSFQGEEKRAPAPDVTPALNVLPEAVEATVGLRIVNPVKEIAVTLPNAENPLSSSAALSPKEIPLDEVERILAAPPHIQGSELQNIHKLPMTEAYARATGQPFTPSNAEKLTALRLQHDGYTPDDIFNLATEKLKTKPNYAFNFVQSDLPTFKRNLTLVPKPADAAIVPPGFKLPRPVLPKVSGDDNGNAN